MILVVFEAIKGGLGNGTARTPFEGQAQFSDQQVLVFVVECFGHASKNLLDEYRKKKSGLHLILVVFEGHTGGPRPAMVLHLPHLRATLNSVTNKSWFSF